MSICLTTKAERRCMSLHGRAISKWSNCSSLKVRRKTKLFSIYHCSKMALPSMCMHMKFDSHWFVSSILQLVPMSIRWTLTIEHRCIHAPGKATIKSWSYCYSMERHQIIRANKVPPHWAFHLRKVMSHACPFSCNTARIHTNPIIVDEHQSSWPWNRTM